MKTKGFKLFLDLAIVYLIVHTIRDLMQFIGMNNLLTRLSHQSGVELTNKILGWFGFSYQRWTEGVWATVEVVIIRKLARLRRAIFSLC